MNSVISRYPHTPTIVPLRSVIDQLFNDSFLSPSSLRSQDSRLSGALANVLETSEAYLVQISVPGIKASSLDVQATGAELRVTGQYDAELPENATVVFQGLPSGEFNQSISLPAEVVGEGADATYKDGLLTVTLPKAEHVKVRSIKVKMID